MVALGARAARGEALLESRLVDIRERHQIRIVLVLEVVYVLSADQSVADESNLDAVVRAEGAPGGRSRHRPQKGPTCYAHGAHHSPRAEGGTIRNSMHTASNMKRPTLSMVTIVVFLVLASMIIYPRTRRRLAREYRSIVPVSAPGSARIEG